MTGLAICGRMQGQRLPQRTQQEDECRASSSSSTHACCLQFKRREATLALETKRLQSEVRAMQGDSWGVGL